MQPPIVSEYCEKCQWVTHIEFAPRHLLCVQGNYTHIPQYVHNELVKRKVSSVKLQQNPLPLFKCPGLNVLVQGDKGKEYNVQLVNLSQLLLDLGEGCVITHFSPVQFMPQ